MPKRIVDGEAIWGSSKIASLPVWAKAEFANWIPLALANGVFECDVRSIWARIYSFNRPEMTPDQVAQILAVFEKAQLIHRFKDKNGKFWGYFIGIHKPGRLPSPSRIDRKHEVCGPEPPQRLVKRWLANGDVGSGSGSGSGSGENLNPPVVPPLGGQTPAPPADTESILEWSRQYVAVKMGKRRRLFSDRDRESLSGARADRVVEFLRQRGFEARLVPEEEVLSWQTAKKATA